MEQPPPAESPLAIQCPTCGARQTARAECRRCKCDLSLYTALLQHRACLREQALRELRQQHYQTAAETARRVWSISPDESATRLLAVAHLLAGDFPAAARAAVGYAPRAYPPDG